MTEAVDTKQSLREVMRRARAALTPEWIASQSECIAKRVIALDSFRVAKTVCLYMALPGEVCLDGVMRHCWEVGKRVRVPAYCRERRVYGFKAVEADSVMVPGLWGVREPAASAWADVVSPACVVIPGVAFGESGGRVGHGKGYYDKLLAASAAESQFVKVGVCFDFQRRAVVPRDTWDVGMDLIVSETRETRLNA